MVPVASPRKRTLLAATLIALFAVGVAQPSVNDLPGFSDHTGPTEMEITEFERLEAGCADAVADYGRSGYERGDYTRVTFVETDRVDADLSAWVERTSPAGADLSTFRIHVQSRATGPANESCDTGVRYRITVTPSGGSPAGLLPDAHGTRVLWLENGQYAGCSASVTSPLDSECERFRDRPDRVWANATSG